MSPHRTFPPDLGELDGILAAGCIRVIARNTVSMIDTIWVITCNILTVDNLLGHCRQRFGYDRQHLGYFRQELSSLAGQQSGELAARVLAVHRGAGAQARGLTPWAYMCTRVSAIADGHVYRNARRMAGTPSNPSRTTVFQSCLAHA